MSKSISMTTGLKFGLLGALLYVISVWLKFRFFDEKIASFSMVAIGGYAVFVIVWIMAALSRRRQTGGYADIRELFQTIFLVIVIGELAYAIFNYVYVSYIDVNFFDRLADNTERLQLQHIKNADNSEQLDQLVQSIRDQQIISWKTALFVFAQAIVFDSILGIIIAFLFKRAKNLSEKDLDLAL
jgi:hypothetical protein